MLVPTNNPDPKVTGTPDPPAPLNLDAADLLTHVVRINGEPVDSTPDTLVPAYTVRAVTVHHTYLDHGIWTTEALNVHERQPVTTLIPTIKTSRNTQGKITYTPTTKRIPVLTPAGDQTGYLPVAQVLDSWVRDWIHTRSMGETPPVPTVPTLATWLNNRLDWALTRYEPVHEFALSIRTLRGQMMRVLCEQDPVEEHCDGIPCPRCDRKELFHTIDGTRDVICRNPDCRTVLRRDEYDNHTIDLDARERDARGPEQIRTLLRQRTPATLPATLS